VLVRDGAGFQSGTTRIRFLMGSLEFFTELNLPALGSTQRLIETSTRNISWEGGKGDQCVSLTTLPPSCADYIETLGSSTSCSPKDSFTFTQTVPFITLVSCPMKIQRTELFQRFHLRLHTLWAVHGLFKHKNGVQRG
jgi:hypothetical protein